MSELAHGHDTYEDDIGQNPEERRSDYVYQDDNEDNEEFEQTNHLPQLDLSDLKFDIKCTDMSENTIKFVAEKTILAFQEDLINQARFEEEGQELSEHKRNQFLSRFIKEEMEMFYKPTWHVIVGENYGSYFTHEQFNMIVFTFKDKYITVFKSNVPPTQDQ